MILSLSAFSIEKILVCVVGVGGKCFKANKQRIGLDWVFHDECHYLKSVEAIPAIPIKREGKTKALQMGMSLGVVWEHFSDVPVKDSRGKEGGNMDPI